MDQNTEHRVRNAWRQLQRQRACSTPDIKAQLEKEMLGFLQLNPTLHTSFKHQNCCSAFGLLDILTANPALIIKILYSLSFFLLHHQMPAWRERHLKQVKGSQEILYGERELSLTQWSELASMFQKYLYVKIFFIKTLIQLQVIPLLDRKNQGFFFLSKLSLID